MERRKLGKTGLEVSFMGIGGIPLQRFDENNTVEILSEAINQGINFIDSARGYTKSEELIGKALKKVGREKFVIATKAQSRDYDGMIKEMDISLKNFQTDYIDLYQCHFVCNENDLNKILSENGALKALLEYREKGLIKHIGITSHNMKTAVMGIESGKFETVQFPFNFIESDGKTVFKKAKEHNMGTIAMKPLGGGAITNRGLSFKYLSNEENLDCIIPGVDNAEQLKSNMTDFLNCYGDGKFIDSERDIIEKEKNLLGVDFCRRCDYCQPCTKNIPISVIFTAKAYYERYNLKDWALGKYKACKANITDCIDCGKCEKRCPYNLPIRQMLRKTHELLAR